MKKGCNASEKICEYDVITNQVKNDEKCQKGYSGFMCSICLSYEESGVYRFKNGGTCLICPGYDPMPIIITLLLTGPQKINLIKYVY